MSSYAEESKTDPSKEIILILLSQLLSPYFPSLKKSHDLNGLSLRKGQFKTCEKLEGATEKFFAKFEIKF